MMKKKVRWHLFRMATILQLLLSSLLSAMLVYQSIRNLPEGDLLWIIAGWLFILLVLASLAALHIHILYRYYPDRLVPRSIIAIRILLSVLGWIAVIILTMAFIALFMREGAWEKFNLKLRLVFIVLFLLTLVSVMGLILQIRLIRHIRNNHQKSLMDTIDQIGQNTDDSHPVL